MRYPTATLLMAGATLVACAPQGGSMVIQTYKPVPQEDGTHVILYDIDVVEDDRDCGAAVPFKESQEEMIVEWHTDELVTVYLREGLYQADATLDDEGRFQRSGEGGPCLVGSTFKGRMDRERGEGEILCRKRECDVLITFQGHKRRPDAGHP
ncbi:MAG: hypothetical protein AB2A00_40000 [Myxococcota bacterium]